MTDTANLALPFIDGAQAQKHVTHNEALRGLDALVQLAVLDRDLTAPPGSPAEGQRWIVAASPTGDWSGQAGKVAAWQDGAWRFYPPRAGWIAYVVDESALLCWNGSAWVDAFTVIDELQNLALLGVGTTADATNPFSAKLNNALWAAKTVAEGGDGNLRYKMSKESAAKTLSLLLQTNFSGRAEIGLTGDDDLHIKVSPDGSTWITAVSIDKSTGTATIRGQIAFPATQNPSSDPNTLDDYEEGTFTPGWSFGGGVTGITYAAQFGSYVKIGRKVTVSGLTQLSSKGSSTGVARMTGLPFASANVANGYTPTSGLFGGMTAAISTFHTLIPPNGTTIDIYKDVGNTYGTATDADFTNTSHLFFTATYLTDN